MRGWIVVVVALAACKGKGTSAPAKVSITAPKVMSADVLAKEPPKPPALLLLDSSSGARIAAAATWADLDAMKLRVGNHPGELSVLDRYIVESKSPLDAVKQWDADYDKPVQLDDGMARTDEEDAPPERSSMTDKKVPNDPLYRMRKYEDPPRKEDPTSPFGLVMQPRGPSGEAFAYVVAPAEAPNKYGTPSRAAAVEGLVRIGGVFPQLRMLIVVAPTVNASVLIEAIGQSGGTIAVSHDGKIRPLNIDFTTTDPSWTEDADRWLEVRVSPTGLEVEAVPDNAIDVATPDELAAALKTARDARGFDDDAPVDVLVTPDVDAQRMIDVAVALELAGVHTIGAGLMPSEAEMARRGHRAPTMSIGQPNAQGDLDKAIIRRFMKRNVVKIKACYTTALIERPLLAGTVQTQFFISPDGIVVSSSASGVDPGVATCVADAVKGIQFPKPKGGGGVQVNYPFTFRP